MKNLMNATVIALTLTALFASSAMAENLYDGDYDYNYNIVEGLQSAPVTKAECDRQASLQNEVDLTLQSVQFDDTITEPVCNHSSHSQAVAFKEMNEIQARFSFDL